MPNKLIISDVEFQNFLSYGDYKTSLSIYDLGPVLIVGDRSDESGDLTKSNGAGKSAITTAILWALFGKTFSLAKPGDKVVNWFTDKNCYVKLRTTDGWEIIRTRKMEGQNELSLMLNGDDKTLSTPTNTEEFIHKYFGLDFDIFTSSVFFGQFSKSFLELDDPKRRAALERLLNLDKLNAWAEVAKSKLDRADAELSKCTTKAESLNADIIRYNEHKASITVLSEGFNKKQASDLAQLQEQLVKEEKELAGIELPDIEKLKAKWDAIAKIIDRLRQYENKKKLMEDGIKRSTDTITNNAAAITRLNNRLKSATLYDTISLELEYARNKTTKERQSQILAAIKEKDKLYLEKSATLSNLKETIDEWNGNAGTTCPHCKQKISSDYATHMCEPFATRASSVGDEVIIIKSDIEKLNRELNELPEITTPIPLKEAAEANASVNLMQGELDRFTEENRKLSEQVASEKAEIASITQLINRVNQQAAEYKPSMTLEEARTIETKKTSLISMMTLTKDRISSTKMQQNPHTQSLQLIDKQIVEATDNLNKLEFARTKLHTLYSHLDYIRSSYKDRNKIKSYILSNLIPTLNKRIQYYLESFDCEFAMEFTPTLAVLPSKWDYHLCSGGERKRIDMAIMFALYDLYIHMYGQQCNIMVLDEVDGRLDADGIQAFINIIYNDFSGSNADSRPKPGSILIISHRSEMLDAFPSKILVKKSQGFSFIESVI